MIGFNSLIETLPGIGSLVLEKLRRLKIKKVSDLLFHLPFRYEDFSNIKKIADLAAEEKATATARILNIANKRTWKRRLNITEALVEDNTAPIRAVWFNQPYLTQTLKKGLWANLSGKVSLDKTGLYFSSPVFEVLGTEEPPSTTAGLHTGGLVAIYPETQGLTSRWLRLKIRALLDGLGTIPDFLPDFLVKEFSLLTLPKTLRQIHFPKTMAEAEEAKRRLSFQDIFLLQLHAQTERQKLKSKPAPEVGVDLDLTKKFIASLPFQLTDSQRLAAWQILKDMEKPAPMNRILVGEVGSGKTVVAAIAALNAAGRGYQIAFLAPTEILALQHFRTLNNLFKDQPIEIALLTSAHARLKGDRRIPKSDLAQRIAAGQIHIAAGTHALIQKEIKFKNLALAVVDEQHRFGVEQRASLLRDPNNPNPEGVRRGGPYGAGASEFHEPEPKIKIIEKELSYMLTGIFFQVQDELGRFCREKQYADALANKFAASGIQFQREVPVEIAGVKSNIVDFIVENKIVIELKAKPFVNKNDYYQMARYLQSMNRELGLLVNFRQSHLKPKRVLNPKVVGQNRFGAFGSSSGSSDRPIPHFLSMSATPIPRTLALTLYGDLDLSTLKELPAGRKKIITKVVAPANREKAYEFIEKQIRLGRQAFVICPRIDADNNADRRGTNSSVNQRLDSRASAWSDVKAATNEYEKLSRQVFPHLKIGLLHGRMKPKEKEGVMKDFKEGRSHILVSTSVVEVGIDVPNASVMMVEGADRFGLAQLHQFRGRVGRAEHQSYCFLFTESPAKSTAARLKVLAESEDGFKLAEKDLQIRGPGQFLGTEQSGLPDLAMSALKDTRLIEEVQRAVRMFLEKSQVDNHPPLAQKLAELKKEIHWE